MAQRVRWRFAAHPSTTPQGFPRSRLTISETMSANAIARRYPSTETLFEQLQIDRCLEGYESVEELAWRHGVELAQLIQQLETAATKREAGS